jgi:hypothetical protein
MAILKIKINDKNQPNKNKYGLMRTIHEPGPDTYTSLF